MKKHIEETLYRLEGELADARERGLKKRIETLESGVRLARRYFARGIARCMEFRRGR